MSETSDPHVATRELLALYQQTHYGVILPDGAAAVLRIGAPLPSAVAAWIGGNGDAAYISACNPCSRATTPADNAERMARLRAELHARALRFLEGAGVIPGAGWSEPSLLVAALPLAELDALARQFQQNAVLAIHACAPPRLRAYAHAGFVRVDGCDTVWASG